MQRADYPAVPPDFGHWLAGFIDGEGCFVVARGGGPSVRGSYYCRFQLKLRDDDRSILAEIQGWTGLGRLVDHRTNRGGEAPAVIWQIATQAECLALVELLGVYPLRAKKARDYAIWSHAVRAWARTARGAAARAGANAPIWDEMERARADLAAIRRYAH